MTDFLKHRVKNLYWSVYGRTIKNPELPSPVTSILFVCKGNICRSPYAEKIAPRLDGSPEKFVFGSAGIRVDAPKPPPAETLLAARGKGVDLQAHRSRQVTYEMMESYDAIAVMETRQYVYLRSLFLEFRRKILLLPLFGNRHGTPADRYSRFNIRDPYGRTLEEFNACFQRIDDCIAGLLHAIR